MTKCFSWGLIISFLFMSYWVLKTPPRLPLPTEGHPIAIYTPRNLHRLYPEAVKASTESIHLSIYNLKEPHVINSMKKKGLEGVRVSVISDASNSKGLKARLGEKILLQERRPHLGIMHNKIMAVDGRRTYIGTANLTKESLFEHKNLTLGFWSPELSQMMADKMGEKSGSLPKTFKVGSHDLEMWFLPDDPGAKERLFALIRGAKKTIKVAMFTWTHLEFADEMIRAKERGVEVKTLIDRASAMGFGKGVVARLHEGGVNLQMSKPGVVLHHKMMLIDDEVLILGSANWTLKAFSKNEDCFFVLHGLRGEEREALREHWEELEGVCERG